MKISYILTLVFSVFLLNGCVSYSQRLALGERDFYHQNYRDAFVRLKPLAEAGEVEAQYAVGYMYFYGQGTYEDEREAFKWIGAAAKAGHPDAKKALALMQRQRQKRLSAPIRHTG